MKTLKARAHYKKGKIYFDEAGWAMVKAAAKRAHKSPKYVVIAGLKRGMKLYGKI